MTASTQDRAAATQPIPVTGRPPGAPFGSAPGLTAGGVAARAAVLAALVSLVLAVPYLVPGVYLNVVSRAAVFAIVALSMNVLIGYTGQVSLGHAAFLGIGAFGAGYTLTELGLPFAVALLVATLTGALGALLLGGVALRVRGLHLALVTLAYGLFAQETIFNIRAITGGGAGMPAARPAFASGDIAYAYLCIAAVAVVLLFDWRLTATRPGRAIQALRDDERVAAAWGMNVTWYKLLAFLISGAIAGLAGGLYASIEQIVAPLDFAFTLSLTFLLMTVLGGVGSRWGVIQGGILVAVLPTVLEWTSTNLAFAPFTVLTPSLAGLVVALLVLLTLAFFPGGFAQLQAPLLRWLSFKPARADDTVPTAPARTERGA